MTYRVKQIGLSTLQWDARDPMPVPYGTKQQETRQLCFLCLGSGFMVDGVFNGVEYEAGPENGLPCRAGCQP